MFGNSETASLGMGGHQGPDMDKDEWLTPPGIVGALGPFDLDPCAPIIRPWPTAARHYTREDNGLLKEWVGRVWLNPPYGTPVIVTPWMRRMASHNRGIALIFARTETDMFFEEEWNRASAVLFLRGRLIFCHVSGEPAKANSGAPSVLVAYGPDDRERLEAASLAGKFIPLSPAKPRELRGLL